MKAKHADICTCAANSPFLWSTRYVPGSSFAADWSENAASAKASTDYVDSQRAAGHDVGHIHGLTDKVPAHRHHPAQFVAERVSAKEREAEVLKPAKSGITIKKRDDGDRDRLRKLRLKPI